MKRFGLIVPVAAVLCLAGVALWWSAAPEVSLVPDAGPVGARKIIVRMEGRRPLTGVTVSAIQGGTSKGVVAKDFFGDSRRAEESFALTGVGLAEGPFTLRVKAGATLILGIPGKSAVVTRQYSWDPNPPAVSVLSTAHNLIQGGAGLVVYKVTKETERTGVTAAERFYPGFRQPGGAYVCLFPFPYDVPGEKYVPRILAVDTAGNERVAGINYHLILKPFSTDTINLTDPLLEKISAEFGGRFPNEKSPLDVFLKVNREVREENRKALAAFAAKTSPTPLWNGAFLRMPGTAPLGGFAQTRTYVREGQALDTQTHLGFDLASVAQAPVPAANRGKVVHAGDLGIYGQCVVIDHGLGLQTLYAHLSSVAVKVGDLVEKGGVVGNTGATGMAGGDHLHFGVTVGGQEVNPVEWWDPSWVRNNVTGKMEAAGIAMP